METYAGAKQKKSTYWRKKNVMKYDEKVYCSAVISDTSLQPHCELPKEYNWEQIDVTNFDKMQQVAEFITKFNNTTQLNENFILEYTPKMIAWQMGNVGTFLVVLKESAVCGLIGISPKNAQIWDEQVAVIQPYFLTVDKEYRSTGLAQTLMDEAIHQSEHLYGRKVGIFSTNKIVPNPVARIRHFYRPINYKYLVEHKFMQLDEVNLEAAHNRTRIRLKPNPKYVVAEKNDKNVQTVHALYSKFMQTFNLHQTLTPTEVEQFLFNDEFVQTLLINDDNGNPVDFISYNVYTAVNKVTNAPVKCANILMYSSLKTREDVILINTLKQISMDGFHIVYMNDSMGGADVVLSTIRFANEDTDEEDENSSFDINFIKTKRRSLINLFNWKCPVLKQTMASWLLF